MKRNIMLFLGLAVMGLMVFCCESVVDQQSEENAPQFGEMLAVDSSSAFVMTREMCQSDPGYWALGYRNLGQCLRYVQTGGGTPPSIYDDEGNVYPMVKIGEQWWMAENLKTTQYNDGEEIEYHDPEQHGSTGAYYVWYDNDESHGSVYGALYGYGAVESGKLCPIGWRVPEWEDFYELGKFLGYYDEEENIWELAGGKMKTTGTIEGGDGLWWAPNTGATNESGWSGVPGGSFYLLTEGHKKEPVYSYFFRDLGNHGYWHIEGSKSFYYIHLAHDNDNLLHAEGRKLIIEFPHETRIGVSVRCIMDR